MKFSPKKTLPVVVLAVALAGSIALVAARPTVATRAPTRPVPLVEAITVQPTRVQLSVLAQGTVKPRTESELVAEVAGRIIHVSSSLASGGFFEQGEVLVRIDPGDYEVAVERGRATLARSQSELELAQSSLKRSESLAKQGVSSTAALDSARARAAVATANERDARAALNQARRDLERTRVVAPFAGRAREKRVDVGQFVSRGAPVGRVYAVDYAEVRLPIPDGEAAFVDLPIGYRDHSDADDEGEPQEGPKVELRAQFAGREYSWTGNIVRTEGELDPRTRMIHAVARVENPYGRSDDSNRPPLAVGLFVEAEIEGREVNDVFVIPRSALRGRNQVLVIDDGLQLRVREVEVLRTDRENVFISSGLAAGERICTSPVSYGADGMRVHVGGEAGGNDSGAKS